MSNKATFVLEIYLEEVPHEEIPLGVKSIKDIFLNFLVNFFGQAKISHEQIKVFSTPRRLAISLQLEKTIPGQEMLIPGPPVKISFSNDAPTKVYQGWAKKNQVPVLDLPSIKKYQVGEKNFGVYRHSPDNTSSSKKKGEGDILVCFKQIPEVKVAQLLKEQLTHLVGRISFSKMMYWGVHEGPFVRPVHSFLAMLADEVIDFELWGVASGNFTFGHSQLKKEKIFIAEASEYQEKLLKEGYVWADAEARKKHITQEIALLSEKENLEVLEKDKVISIVNNLTEYPHLLLGEFDKSFLSLPRELIINELVEHQKYFPTEKNGSLTNQFIITSNIPAHEEVKLGNEKVVRARLNDGKFLYASDLKLGLEEMKNRLAKVVFQEQLGTYQDKYHRMLALAQSLNEKLNFGLDEATITEATQLAKADLTSGLVAEFPELQGVIGFYYAKAEKRNLELALSLKEHYYPVGQNHALPSNDLGILVSLSDKLDNVLSLFLVGFSPTASQDRYALKRQGYAVVRMLVEKNKNFDLLLYLEEAKSLYKKFFHDEKEMENWELSLKDFFEARVKSYFQSYFQANGHGEKYGEYKEQHLKAIQGSLGMNPYLLKLGLVDLGKFMKNPDYEDIANLFKRIDNILEKSPAVVNEIEKNKYELKENLFEDVEKILWQTKVKLDGLLNPKNPTNTSGLVSTSTSTSLYQKLISLVEYKNPLGSFFDQVLINHSNQELKMNRYFILSSIREQIEKVIKFSFLYNKK